MGQGTRLHIITEPEAAAMHALDIMDPRNIQIGDTFVLCDAGGGTIDIVQITASTSMSSKCSALSSVGCRIRQRAIATTLAAKVGIPVSIRRTVPGFQVCLSGDSRTQSRG